MSIFARITIRLTIVTVIAIGATYAWLFVKQSKLDTYLHQRTLTQQAREISRYLSINNNGEAEINLPSELSEAYNNPTSAYRYIIRDESGRIIAISSHRIGPISFLFPTAKRGVVDNRNFSENRVTLPAHVGSHTFIIRVEESKPLVQSLHASVLNEFIADGEWLAVPFLLALLFVSLYTVRRSLSPLIKLATIATKINPGNSDVRLPQKDVPSEFLPLVRTINGALDRLDEGLKRQREFGANAAHQLRTPIAVLSANLDLMDDKALAHRLRHDVDAMGRIVSQLLLIARLEALNIPLDQEIDLRTCAQAAARNLGPLAISNRKNLEIDEPEEPVLVLGNKAVVTAAVSNLIENALNHSPPEGTVRVCVTPNDSIEVTDSGPGIPEGMREKVFERFWQGENSKGAGLGLSIVRQIMHALKGTVSVSDSPFGGASFVLQFPRYQKMV